MKTHLTPAAATHAMCGRIATHSVATLEEFNAHADRCANCVRKMDTISGEMTYRMESRCATDDVVCGPVERQVFGCYVATRPFPAKRAFFSWRKVGGLRHWRIGRFGGSFYIAKPHHSQWAIAIREGSGEVAATVAVIVSLFLV